MRRHHYPKSQAEKFAQSEIHEVDIRRACDYKRLNLSQITDAICDRCFGVEMEVPFWMWMCVCVRVEKLLLGMVKSSRVRVIGTVNFEERTDLSRQLFITHSWR